MLGPKLFKTTPKSLKNFYEGHLGQVFKNWPSKICGRQPLNNLK